MIEWNDEPSRFISNSLSPAVVEKVSLDEESHTATVTVPDRQLSLAIGREGQNARLAAKLTNWRIDIQGATQLQQAAAPAVAAAVAEAVAPAPVAAAPVTAVEKPAPDANRGAEPQAAPSRPVRESAAQPRPGPAPATAGAGRLEEALALKQLEEELAVLEKQEAERRESEAAAAPVDVSSDDLWQMPAMGQPQQPGVLRFAEDIMSDRELSTGRRGSRGKRPGPKPQRPSRPGPSR